MVGGTGDRSRSRCTSICHSCSASSCDIYSYVLLLVILNILVAMTEALQQGIVSPIKFPGSRMDETLVLSLTRISSRVSFDSGFSTTQHHRFNVVFAMVTKKMMGIHNVTTTLVDAVVEASWSVKPCGSGQLDKLLLCRCGRRRI